MSTENYLQELNTEQLLAVQEVNRNIILSAGAGTGKTKVLTTRVINILEHALAAPEEILCLTFTNKACKEMQERILASMPSQGKKINIRTIHGFGYQIINETNKAHDPDFQPYFIYDEEDQNDILNELCFSKGLYQGNKNNLRAYIELCKQIRFEHNVFSNDLEDDFAKVRQIILKNNPPDELQRYLTPSYLDLVISYQRLLDKNHGLDFKDLTGMALQILRNSELCKIWHDKYKFILIDEFQDTSRFEYEMLSPLFPSNNIMLCGDLFQTIYGWRGSDPQNILKKFLRDFNPVEIHLRENYRSSRILLEMSFQALQQLFDRQIISNSYAKDLISKSSVRGHKIIMKNCCSYEAEAHWIIEKIKDLLPKVSSPTDIAILTRTNNSVQNLLVHLKKYEEHLIKTDAKQKFEFIAIEAQKFFRKKEIKDVCAVMKYLANPYDNHSLKRILLNLVPGIGAATINTISKPDYREAGLALSDFINYNGTDCYSDLVETYHNGYLVVFDVESTGTNIFTDHIIQISALKIYRGEVIGEFNKYLIPPVSVGTSEAIHHISDAFLAENGQEPLDVLRDFADFCKGCTLAGHNILNFDINIVAAHFRRYRIGFDLIKAYDTLEMCRKFYPHAKNHKLEYLSRAFNFSTASTHNAYDDVLANWELLHKLLEEKIIPLLPTRKVLLEKYQNKFKEVQKIFRDLKNLVNDELSPEDLLYSIIKSFHLKTVYREDTEKGQKSIASLRTLYRIIRHKITLKGYAGIQELLQFATLSTALDLIVADHPVIPVITIHQAKGLEFKYEFLTDVTEGVFPNKYVYENPKKLEEEKRIFYVAITRAKEELFISYRHKPSKFLASVSDEFIEKE